MGELLQQMKQVIHRYNSIHDIAVLGTLDAISRDQGIYQRLGCTRHSKFSSHATKDGITF